MKNRLAIVAALLLCACGGEEECRQARVEAQGPWEEYVTALEEAHQTRAREIEETVQAGLTAAEECRQQAVAPPSTNPATGLGPLPAPAGTGTLAREAILAVTQGQTSEIRGCYTSELRLDPTLEGGRLTISFMIGTSGAVESKQIATSTLGNTRVEMCILALVGQWSFPAPEGGPVVVNYPINLRASAPTCPTEAQVRSEVTRPELPVLADAQSVLDAMEQPVAVLEEAWRSFRANHSQSIPDGPLFTSADTSMETAVELCRAAD